MLYFFLVLVVLVRVTPSCICNGSNCLWWIRCDRGFLTFHRRNRALACASQNVAMTEFGIPVVGDATTLLAPNSLGDTFQAVIASVSPRDSSLVDFGLDTPRSVSRLIAREWVNASLPTDSIECLMNEIVVSYRVDLIFKSRMQQPLDKFLDLFKILRLLYRAGKLRDAGESDSADDIGLFAFGEYIDFQNREYSGPIIF
jgi:hypothetical protein